MGSVLDVIWIRELEEMRKCGYREGAWIQGGKAWYTGSARLVIGFSEHTLVALLELRYPHGGFVGYSVSGPLSTIVMGVLMGWGRGGMEA